MEERGVVVDHTTLFRWVQRYAPLMEKRPAFPSCRLMNPAGHDNLRGGAVNATVPASL
jgi:hypothetical protein